MIFKNKVLLGIGMVMVTASLKLLLPMLLDALKLTLVAIPSRMLRSSAKLYVNIVKETLTVLSGIIAGSSKSLVPQPHNVKWWATNGNMVLP